MRLLKHICVVGIVSLFFSCSYQEDTVAFFIDNQLKNQLIIDGMDENSNKSIHQSAKLDLTSVESFNRYISNLKEVEITRVTCNFDNYQGAIHNGKIHIDDIFLGDFNKAPHKIDIVDTKILKNLGNKFLDKTTLEFYFSGNSSTKHFLNVSIKIEFKGTFVN